jgi:hypothetical protein
MGIVLEVGNKEWEMGNNMPHAGIPVLPDMLKLSDCPQKKGW